MSGLYSISSFHPRLIVRKVSQDEVVSVCMVAPHLTKEQAREEGEFIVNALNAYHPTPKPTLR